MRLLIATLFFLFIWYRTADANNINFRHITITDGLSQNAITAIIQDSEGFMWFGTRDGLNKFNGYEFQTFYHNAFDLSTISGNHITALKEDSRGYIWVGTISGGLNCYHPKDNKFYPVQLQQEMMEFPEYYEIRSIIEDNNGNILVATWGDGIYKLNAQNFYQGEEAEFHCTAIKIPINDLKYSKIFNFIMDSAGVIWIASEEGLYEYNEESGSFAHLRIPGIEPLKEKDPYATEINSIYSGGDGYLWLGNNSGLLRLNKQTKESILYPHHSSGNKYARGKITSIVQDSTGTFWLASPTGLIRFNPSESLFEYIQNDPFDPKSLSYNLVLSLFVDKTGLIWIGTSGMGLNVFDPLANRFSILETMDNNGSRLSGFSVNSILEDQEGMVWISAGVLYRWNRQKGELYSYTTQNDIPENFGNVSIWSMIQATDGKIWATSDHGLFCHNPLTGKTQQFRFDPNNPRGIPEKIVCAVLQDKEGSIWTATESFLSRLDKAEAGNFIHYRYPTGPLINKQPRVVMYEDKNKDLWLGTNYGLIHFKNKTESFEIFRQNPDDPCSLCQNVVKSICPDPQAPDEALWIGTDGGGLCKFYKSSKKFEHYTTNDGLPNNVVYAILPDNAGNLWLSTNKGISKFNPTLRTFRNYDTSDGLQSNEFNTGAFFRSPSGEMFLGGIMGLNYFFPEKVKDNLYKPSVMVTKIIVRGKKRQGEPDSLMYLDTQSKEIILSHNENYISFEFAALNYSAPEKSQYAYKLENFSNNWIYSGTNRNASFTHLPPGKYIFRVKASNNDGIWNEQDTTIKLIINPPWWGTSWAFFSLAVLLLGILFLIRKYEISRIDLKNQLIFEKVKTDTLRTLDDTKSNFFANISHEFRTPLSLILGNIGTVMDNGIGETSKQKLKVADSNAKKLLHLINQILELSKIEAGGMKLDSRVQNIVIFLKGLFYSFEDLAMDKKIRIKFSSDKENIPVLFDPDKIEKVFYNLLSNAFKFTDEYGEIHITVRTTGKSWVEIKVIDNGIGIPEESLSKVFDRFYQVDMTNSRKHEGTGIGLALVKELVELHEGKISVSSMPEKGTEFTVILPRVSDLQLSHQNLEVNNIENVEEELSGHSNLHQAIPDFSSPLNPLEGNEIILIVEDNKDLRDLIKGELLEEYGIIEAVDGQDGLEIARKELPDLIITDLMMPRMDGYQFCKEIRQDERTGHIPIIMLTARAGMDDKIEGLKTGIDDYLSKPFNSKELKARIKNLIHQRKNLKKRFSQSTVIKPTEVSVIPVDQVFLEKVLEIIESHFEDENFSVEILAEKVNMSVSQINRKLNALIDQPAGQLIRSLRLQRAADLISQNAGSISEICYQLAFSDQAYFSRAFKKQFGTTPTEYKNQFQQKSKKKE